MNSYCVNSYAKVNIGLQILNKRPDSYHNINTLFQEIDLCDTIELRKKKHGCNFSSNVDWLKNNKSNLCVNAWSQLSNSFDIGGVSIFLKKKIPPGSGLGGGSSNAAAIIKGLCYLYSIKPTHKDLISIATNLGADVPFFLNGGLQSASGIGENLIPLPGSINGTYLLVIPDCKIDTTWAYNKYKNFLDSTREALNFVDILI